ncbi:Uncharacterised protein [Achromobacter xylosoxidans]|nr:Uncharacterised protein [Achromobacter xylosoxidans]CUK20274.1 Uncharacterised protein [Achromobacter xylosoxidans]
MPTTAAFTPATMLRTPGRRRRLSQNGKAAATSNAPGRKMATSIARPPAQPDKGPAEAEPRKAAKVNKGPGTACATP